MSRYSLASSTWDEKELSAIQSVIDSNMFTMGKHVIEYERTFADFFGSKYAVMVNSGSSANLLMIASLFYSENEHYRLKPGDEVIVPAVSWSTTYFPLQQYGLKVRFVDIDADTLNLNIEKLKESITDNTRAILVVNLLGNPNDFNEIKKIISDKNIILLEDNCESMGATFLGQQAGTFGLMGSYSSFFSHHIATMEGGCVVTDDEELYHILLCMRAHGWTRNLPKENCVTGIKSDDPFDESFKFALPGYNLRPLEMSAAIGIEQLKKLPDFINVRRQNSELFQELFYEHPYLKIQKETGCSSWFGFALTISDNERASRKDLVNKLTENQVECRPIVSGNFTKNIALKYFDYDIPYELVNADRIDNDGFFVGNHQIDLYDEISFLRKVLN